MDWSSTAGLVAALAGGTGAWITEQNLRIRRGRKEMPEQRLAEELAARSGARLEQAAVVTADGLRLNAWVFVPPGAPRAAALLMHGYTHHRAYLLDRAEALLALGCAVMTPDQRAHGFSGGDLITFGVRERNDAADWLAWLRREFPGLPCIGVGQSMGAAVVLQSLEAGARYEALWLEAPFTSFPRVAVERLAGRTGLPYAVAAILVAPAARLGYFYAWLRYRIWLPNASPARAMALLESPAVLAHGMEDDTIHPRHSEDLHRMQPTLTSLWQVEGAEHSTIYRTAPDGWRERMNGLIGRITSPPASGRSSEARSAR